MAGKSVKWSLSELQTIGREALALAKEFRSAIEPRLPAGLLDGLEVDLDGFDDKRAAATNALSTLKLETLQQEAAAESAAEFLSAARASVVRAGASAAQREAFGTTRKYNVNKVSSVVAALDAFAAGAAKFPDFARSAGVLSADLDAARELRDALIASDQSQEAQKTKRKSPTAQRNDAQKRIEGAIDTIINAGRLAFIGKLETAARFRDLIPSSKATSSKKPAPGA